MKSGIVLSDLHIFAQRSNAGHYIKVLHEAMDTADFLVLNGDIFDFKWSVLPGIEETLAEAINWLRVLSEAHPHCTIFYILGNHDALEIFAVALENLSKEIANFFWHPTHLRIDDALYLHGDLPLRGKKPFQRSLKPFIAMKRKHMHLLYNVTVHSRLHRASELFISKSLCAAKILSVFDKHPTPVLDDIADVYFGHTHVAFSDFKFKGITFHNTGATIHGVKTNMMKFSIQKSERIH